MMSDRASDSKITAATGRIPPDRRWFGNTCVVNPSDLDRFREEMTESLADLYSVVIKRKALPMGLLRDAAELEKKNNSNGSNGNGVRGSALLVKNRLRRRLGKRVRGNGSRRLVLERWMVLTMMIVIL